jgi:hypothetical protein
MSFIIFWIRSCRKWCPIRLIYRSVSVTVSHHIIVVWIFGISRGVKYLFERSLEFFMLVDLSMNSRSWYLYWFRHFSVPNVDDLRFCCLCLCLFLCSVLINKCSPMKDTLYFRRIILFGENYRWLAYIELTTLALKSIVKINDLYVVSFPAGVLQVLKFCNNPILGTRSLINFELTGFIISA